MVRAGRPRRSHASPTDRNRKVQTEEHQVIRLITRLMFIWFIKEKGLVAPESFRRRARVRGLAQGLRPRRRRLLVPSECYRTCSSPRINTEIAKRRDLERSRQQASRTGSSHGLYRYLQDLMADPDRLD